MSTKPFVFAAALSLIAATNLVFAESPAAAAEAVAAVGLLPAAAATQDTAQSLDDLQVEAPRTADEPTPAQRRAANRKAREELRRRFGPSLYVLN
ncbi:MAG: hypothetical protein WC809_02855 [Sinimarinibacterium sp.]|jgi:hypothetical protein